MTIVDIPEETQTAFGGRTRVAAALALIVGPVLMMLSPVAAIFVEQAAPGKDDLVAAMAAPTAATIGSLLDILTVPAMLAFALVIFQATRRWSPRAAWIGTVAMILQLCGLAVVTGFELLSVLLARHGVDPSVINNVNNNDVTSNAAGITVFIMFMPMELVGLIALGVALWRTRWVPRAVPILMWIFAIVNIGAPDNPEILHVGAFVIFLAAFAVLARKVLAGGAALPSGTGHTR